MPSSRCGAENGLAMKSRPPQVPRQLTHTAGRGAGTAVRAAAAVNVLIAGRQRTSAAGPPPGALDRTRFVLRLDCNKKFEPANSQAERVMKWTF